MTQTRIYLPLGAADVRRLVETRELGPAPLDAFAVTERLERSLPTGDEEEWEYAAQSEAVVTAGERREAPHDKRVVAAADVEPDWVDARPREESLAAVRITEPVPLSRIASFHIDEEPGAIGTEDLLWYDATELDEVARLL